jgi:hypothetical protein
LRPLCHIFFFHFHFRKGKSISTSECRAAARLDLLMERESGEQSFFFGTAEMEIFKLIKSTGRASRSSLSLSHILFRKSKHQREDALRGPDAEQQKANRNKMVRARRLFQ